MNKPSPLIPVERIQRAIYLIRGEKVMLDSDLAVLYGVSTKVLNRAVKRNANRFPEDFMVQLSAEELEALRCQIGTSNTSAPAAHSGLGRGGRSYPLMHHQPQPEPL